MAFLPAERNEIGKGWYVKCMTCGKIIAIMSAAELLPFLAFLTHNPQPVLCFECEDDWYRHKWAAVKLGLAGNKPPACLDKHISANDAQ